MIGNGASDFTWPRNCGGKGDKNHVPDAGSSISCLWALRLPCSLVSVTNEIFNQFVPPAKQAPPFHTGGSESERKGLQKNAGTMSTKRIFTMVMPGKSPALGRANFEPTSPSICK